MNSLKIEDMKKVGLLIALLTLCGFAFSQTSLNLDSDYYLNFSRWENLGLVDKLPEQKPYSYFLVESLLKTVMECDDEVEAEKAAVLYKKLTGKKLYIYGLYEENLNAKQDFEHQELFDLGVEGEIPLFPYAAISYELKDTIQDNSNLSFPVFTDKPHGTAADPAHFGPFSANLNMNTVASFGTKDISVLAGLAQSNFSPMYYESIVLDKNLFHSEFISFVLDKPKFNYTQTIYALTATNNSNTILYPEKYMAFHSATLKLLPWFSLLYYENMIYGGRFDLAYLLPTPFMVSQSLSGFADNLQMGIGLRFYPLTGLKLSADVFVDDLNVNELVKFNFDTRLYTAFLFGSQYTPGGKLGSVLKNIEASYTLIAPYIYSHQQYNKDALGNSVYSGIRGANYQNYSHYGYNIATPLYPNSDKINLVVTLEPVSNLKISCGNSFVRHGNISESITTEEAGCYLKAEKGEYVTDGSYKQHPEYSSENGEWKNRTDTSEKFDFLKQNTLMYVFNDTLKVEYTFRPKYFESIKVYVQNVFEYIKNDGVQNEIYPGQSLSEASAADVQNYYKTWKDNIRPDTFNDYITIGVSLCW